MNSQSSPLMPADGPPAADVFDYQATLTQIGDDPELLSDLIQTYLEQLPRLLPQIEDAVRRRESLDLRRSAHALSSATSVLWAPRAREVARRLELMGRDNRLDGVEEAHAALTVEMELLAQALRNPARSKAA